jgi:hypothetical protein
VSGVEWLEHGASVAGDGQLTDVTVQCSSGKVAIAGGFGANDTNVEVHASLFVNSHTAWTIEVRNFNAFAVPVTAQAVCAIVGS